MAFGTIYIKTVDGWKPGPLYTKDATSWKPVVHLYEKTAPTVWTERFNADLVPPGVIVFSAGAHNTTTKTYSVTVKLAADVDVTGGCLKMSKTAYPTNPGVVDANSFTNTQADGQPHWSWTGAPGSTTTRVTPALSSGTKYYVTGWTRDASGNWSAPTQYTTTTPLPPAPSKVLTTKTAYVTCTDSASYRSSYGWRTDNNYVYQGSGDNFQGFWFYGTAIYNLIKNAYDLTKVELYVQRSSSSHGIAGDGNIMIGHHDLTSQPSGSPGSNRVVGEYNAVDLGRGEGKTITLKSDWHNNFLSGEYRGIGMMYGTTSTTSSYYNICYGKGTTSGRLKFTWREYV
jgi:hypothetical protein